MHICICICAYTYVHRSAYVYTYVHVCIPLDIGYITACDNVYEGLSTVSRAFL